MVVVRWQPAVAAGVIETAIHALADDDYTLAVKLGVSDSSHCWPSRSRAERPGAHRPRSWRLRKRRRLRWSWWGRIGASHDGSERVRPVTVQTARAFSGQIPHWLLLVLLDFVVDESVTFPAEFRRSVVFELLMVMEPSRFIVVLVFDLDVDEEPSWLVVVFVSFLVSWLLPSLLLVLATSVVLLDVEPSILL